MHPRWRSPSQHLHRFNEVIGCRISRDAQTDARRLHVVEEERHINHWVGCIPESDHEGIGHALLEETSDDETETFQARYRSVDRIVLETVDDGDCGLDVLNMMAGSERRLESREELRNEIARFLLKHAGNRALIAMLRDLGELSHHLGRFELEGDAAKLLAPHGEHDTDHGDGAVMHVIDSIFTAEEVQAVKWKCQLYKSSPQSVQRILSALPHSIIQQAVQEYQRREPPKPPSRKIAVLQSRDAKLPHKLSAARHFLQFCKETYGTDRGDGVPRGPQLGTKEETALRNGKTPRGWFKAYTVSVTILGKHTSTKNSYKKILQLYQTAVKLHYQERLNPSAVADADPPEHAVSEDNPNAKHKNKTPRVGAQYWKHQLHFARDWERRRGIGAGRHTNQCVVRQMLMEWWGIIRHSVDVKIMVRIPKKVLLVKAQMLQEEYFASCLRNRVEPERVSINPRWLNTVLLQNRIVHRRPNRKFKVPRWVLAERLEIFWIDIHCLRKLIWLHFQYLPVIRNIDQSPFHKNEAGSAEWGTLTLQNAPTVPLIQDHAATRLRISLNSVTVSDPRTIQKKLPGFEMMFKAEGHTVEKKLQAYVLSLGLPFKVTVVTGPSGSYREEHIIAFFDKHLEPWYPGKRWEIMLLDAYAPGLTDNVQRFCWSRMCVVKTHGGGASMVAQTNDTNHHQEVRKRYTDIESDKMIRKARAQGGGMVELTREEILDTMIEVMADRQLHIDASKGYIMTGTTVAFDGSQDAYINREAGVFWRELKMREKIDAKLKQLEEDFKAGQLPWNYKTVMGLIKPYPRRGKLDKLEPGQEDIATPDPDGKPWEIDDGGGGEGDGGEGEGDGGEGDIENDPVPEFDADDWALPPEALGAFLGGRHAESERDGEVEGHHGDGEPREGGDVQEHHGDGELR